MSSRRLDVSAVRPQGGYVAKRCPVRAQNDFDSGLADSLRLPDREAAAERMRAGVAFEGEVFEAITTALGHESVLIDGGDREAMADRTVRAMQDGVRVILGGRLPDDVEGRRAGYPDLLVRATSQVAGSWTYVPIDVKNHTLTADGVAAGSTLRWSPMLAPETVGSSPEPNRRWVTKYLREDALQLAHYFRMLDASGHSGTGTDPIGGIIDKERRVWWVDLAESRWSCWWSDELVTTLDLYDHEFDFRLDVIAHTLFRNENPDLPRKVLPVDIAECQTCPWRRVCGTELRDIDHVSLLPRTGWAQFVEHRRRDVLTRRQVADLDWDLASALWAGKTMPLSASQLGAALDRSDSTSIAVAMSGIGSKLAAQQFSAIGIGSVGALRRANQDPRLALPLAYAGAKVGHLPTLIDQARAAITGPRRARGIEQLDACRADIEVDVDMESVGEHAYLWGALVTETDGQHAVKAGYYPFVSWKTPSSETAARVFAEFWTWLQDLRRHANVNARSFRAYCYSAAENTVMRRVVRSAGSIPGVPGVNELEDFIASSQWVDLHAHLRSQVVTGGSLSLKVAATELAGFAWRDVEPGGDESMLWHRGAIEGNPLMRWRSRRRLLRYNEDDVRATRALRDWLERTDLPSVGEWP